MSLNRREFIRISSLPVAGALAFPAAMAAQDPGPTLNISLDLVLQPAAANASACGIAEPRLWLIVRPTLTFKRDTATEPNSVWAGFLAALTGGPLAPRLELGYLCHSSAESDTWHHVNLPHAWNSHLQLRTASGEVVRQVSVLRASRLPFLSPASYQKTNNGVPEAAPLQAYQCLSSATVRSWVEAQVGAPFAAVFNQAIAKACESSSNENACGPDGPPNSRKTLSHSQRVDEAIGQMNLALTLGSRRYASTAMFGGLDTDPHVMRLRGASNAADALIETNIHSLLGLAIHLASGATEVRKLAAVRSFTLAFSEDKTPDWNSLGDRSMNRDSSDLFQCLESLDPVCASLPANFDVVEDDVPFASAVLAQQSLTQSQILVEHDAGPTAEHVDFYLTAPEAPFEDTESAKPVEPRSVQDYLLLGTRAELTQAASTLATAINGFSVASLRLEPFRRYARLHRLLPIDAAGQEFLDDAAKVRAAGETLAKPLQGAIADWPAGATYVEVEPSLDPRSFALIGTGMRLIVVRSSSADGALPAGAYLDVDKGKTAPARLRLLRDAQSGVFDAAKRAEITLSPAPGKTADSSLVARPLVWSKDLVPRMVRVRLAKTQLKKEEARALCSRLVYRFANDFEFSLAQSLGSACMRVAVDYGFNDASFACEAERYAEIVREAALGDRRSYTALNVYEQEQASPPQHVETDPLGGAGHSGWVWRNPLIECYPWKSDNACNPSPTDRFRARFWTQVSEAVEFRPDVWANNAQADNPEQLLHAVRDFYRAVYRRTARGLRTLRFTAEGTFGVERDLTFDRATGTGCAITTNHPRLPSTADWPIMHLADASMVDQARAAVAGKPNAPVSIPLLSFSMGRDDGLQLNFNSCALLPPPDMRWPKDNEHTADERERQRGPMLAFFRSWQALAEVAEAETIDLVVSRLRFDFRALVRTRGAPGFVLEEPFQLVEPAVTLSLQNGRLKALRDHALRLLSGEVGLPALVDGRADGHWPVQSPEDLAQTHVIGMHLTLSRGPNSAPAAEATYHVAHLGSPGEPLARDASQADRLVSLADTEATQLALKAYLAPRRSLKKLVRRHRMPGEKEREGFMRSLGLDHARFRDLAKTAGEWVVPPRNAAPDRPGAQIEVAVVPLAFRSPVRLAKVVGGACDPAQLDERLGSVAFEPLMKLIEALDPLVAGTWKSPNSHDRMLAGFEECAHLVNRWIEELSQLIAPVHEAAGDDQDDHATVRRLLSDWDAGDVKPWVVAWCREQLIQSPRFFVDTALVLLVRLAGTSTVTAVPADFARLDLTFERAGIYKSDAAPGKSAPKLTYSVVPSDLVQLTDGGFCALVPVSFSDAAAYLTWEGGSAFRIEHELQRWETASTAAADDPALTIPIGRYAAPAKRPDPLAPTALKLRVPARTPAPAPRVICAGKAMGPDYEQTGSGVEKFSWDGQKKLSGNFHTARRIEAGLSPLAALPSASPLHRRATTWSEAPRTLAVDEYVARYVVAWPGDRYASDQDATDVVRLRLRPPVPTFVEGPPASKDPRDRTVIDALMELRDPTTFELLPSLVFDGLLRCSELAGNFQVELPGEGALSPCVLPGQLVDPTPDQTALQIRVETRDGALRVTSIDGCNPASDTGCAPLSAALYGTRAEAEEANEKALGQTSTLYLAVDFVQSRWRDLVLAAQIERNPPGDGTEWPMSRAYLSLSEECLVPFVPAAAPEIGAWDTADRRNVARLPQSQLSWAALLGALFNGADRPLLSDMDMALRGASQDESVVLTFFHRQQLSAYEITNSNVADLKPLTEPSYAALERNLTVLTGPTRQPNAALEPVIAAAARGVRNFAVDIEWRDAKQRARLRLSKWAFDLF